MLQDGMDFLSRTLMASAVDVIYRRGVTDIALRAVRAGVSWNAIERSNGGALESSARDFIVKMSDLGLEPLPKDKILDGSETWTVFNQLDAECWRKVGDSGLIRIHCRK